MKESFAYLQFFYPWNDAVRDSTVDTEQLARLLQSLVDGNTTGADADALIRFAVERTEYVLEWLSYAKNYQVGVRGVSIRDLAFDIVAELFASEEENCCRTMRAALLAEKGKPGVDFLSMFDSILIRNVHQHLPRIFGEVNPLFQSLLRSLRGHVSRSSDIHTLDRFDGRWYVPADQDGTALMQPAMPFDELRHHIELLPRESSAPVVRVFRSALALLDSHPKYRCIVLEADILTLTRELLGIELLSQSPLRTAPETELDAPLLGRILMESLDRSMSWIDEVYLQKGRLTRKELDCFIMAIKSYFKDLMSDEQPLAPFAYLRHCMPGLTHARFRESYRRKFEYILQRVLDDAYLHLGDEAKLLR